MFAVSFNISIHKIILCLKKIRIATAIFYFHYPAIHGLNCMGVYNQKTRNRHQKSFLLLFYVKLKYVLNLRQSRFYKDFLINIREYHPI